MVIGIPIYEGVDLLDVAAPYEVFNLMKQVNQTLGAEIYLVAEDSRTVKTRDGFAMKP